MKSVSKKLICAVIITLIVGVSYSSAIRVENNIVILYNQDENDCGCNYVSDSDITELDNKLNNMQRNSKLLLLISKDIPKIKGKIEELSYKISNLREKLENGPPNSILCVLFIGLFIVSMVILSVIGGIIFSLPLMPDIILDFFSSILFVILFEELALLIYYCGIGPYVPTLSNLNNLKNKGNHFPFLKIDNKTFLYSQSYSNMSFEGVI